MWRTCFLKLLVLAIGLVGVTVGSSPAAAQAGVAGRAVPLCIERATPGATARAVLTVAGRFDCVARQTSFGAGDYWVRSGPLSSPGQINVRIASLWQDRVTLHALYADGAIATAMIDGRGASRRMQLGAIIEQRLPTRPARLIRLLWHVEGSPNMRGILLGARIATPEESARSNLIMGAIYAAFAGLCVALLIYNLALWAALRHRFQLAYCAMVLALLVYAFSSSGALAWLWPGVANNDRMRINYVALAMAGVAALSFARAFFEVRVFAGALARLSNVTCIAVAGTAALFALCAPWHIALLDRLYTTAFLGQMLIVLPILWRGWCLRSNYLWLFALAWAAPITLASLRVAGAFRLIGWNFWLDNSTILTMTLEALLSSLAIAYRIRLLSVERDEARAQEIAARLLADTDPLTGLLNRRAFLTRAIGREGDQVLLIVDLDHFKQVNETIGHDGGDEVLRIVARTLRQSIPPEALVARIGGEEFAVVTPVAFAIQPEDILARLRAGRMPFDLSVTASIGTCTGPLRRETDWKALYCQADRALFEAKAAGRDRARQRGLPDRIAA